MFLSNFINLIYVFKDDLINNVLEGFLLGAISGIMIIYFIFLFIFIILLLIIYIYNSLVWSTIAKKLNYSKYWIAWIPVANFFLKPILASYNWKYGFIIVLPIVFLLVSLLAPLIGIIFLIFSFILIITMNIIWCWEIFKKRGFAGEFALVEISIYIPILTVIGQISYMVLLGFIAWSNPKEKKIKKNKNTKTRNIKTKNTKTKNIK
jgi:hypothetical protein